MRASSCQRVAMCPGSERASWGLKESPSDDASRGTRIHEYLAVLFGGGDFPQMITEEIETAQELARKIVPLIPEEDHEIFIERAFSAHGWTGHLDLLIVPAEGGIIVVDWKSGWGDVPEPMINAQIRVYSCLVAEEYPGRNIRATICSPRGVATPVLFTSVDIAMAWEELAMIKATAESANSKRIPAPDSCKYCRAFSQPTCPETCHLIQQIPEVTALAEMGDAQLASLGRLGKLAEKQIKKVIAEIRSRIENGEDVPGCSIGKATSVREISDIGKAFAIMAELTETQFLSACKCSLKKLADVVSTSGDIPKAQAKREVDDMLDLVIVNKPKKGSLKIS